MTRSPQPGQGHHRRRRSGFSLIEMTVVCFMMALMASLMAGAWSAFGRPAADVDARCRIAQEASLAAESLSRDLAGYLPGANGRLGGLASSKFVSRLTPENTSLHLCFDSQLAPNGIADWGPPDTVIVYQLVDDRLVRADQEAGTTVTVARYLTSFQVVDQGSSVKLDLTFKFRNFQRVYTLVGVDP